MSLANAVFVCCR